MLSSYPSLLSICGARPLPPHQARHLLLLVTCPDCRLEALSEQTFRKQDITEKLNSPQRATLREKHGQYFCAFLVKWFFKNGLESYFQEVEMHLRHWGDNVGTAKLSLLSAYHRFSR